MPSRRLETPINVSRFTPVRHYESEPLNRPVRGYGNVRRRVELHRLHVCSETTANLRL
jgi:hypothetical protein